MERVLWVNLGLFCWWSCRNFASPKGTYCLGGVVGGGGSVSFSVGGHKCAEETLVALKKSQINSLNHNDSQVWAVGTAICSGADGGTSPSAAVALQYSIGTIM